MRNRLLMDRGVYDQLESLSDQIATGAVELRRLRHIP
jgi:hypothetical protein